MAFTPDHKPGSFRLVRVCLCVLVFLVFSPCLFAQFLIWDDQHFIQNPFVQQLTFSNIAGIFRETILFTYMPLTTFSICLEKALIGLNPFSGHLINLILHVTCMCLALKLAVRLGLKARAAVLAAFLFGLHPMHVESVAWFTERKDVLYSVFYLFSLLSWVSFLKSRRNGVLICGLCFGILSLLTKPMALSLPLVMGLILVFREGKAGLRKYWVQLVPFVIVSVGIAGLSYINYARMPLMTLDKSILVWLWSLAFYFSKYLFPVVCQPVYPLPLPVTLSHWQYALTILFLGSAGWGLWRLRHDRWVILAFGWFFCSIFFMLRFDGRDAQVVADRFMYLPSLGFCFLFGYWIDRWMLSGAGRKVSVIVVILLTVLAGKTFAQCAVWRDDITLWTYTIKHYPKSEIAYLDRALAYTGAGRIDLAIQDYTTALSFFPNKVFLYYYRGLVRRMLAERLVTEGKTGEAQGHFLLSVADLSESIRLDPRYYESFYNRSVALFKLGRIQEALLDCDKVVKIAPLFAKGYNNRAVILARVGRNKEALADLDRALELDLSLTEARVNRAIVLRIMGDTVQGSQDQKNIF